MKEQFELPLTELLHFIKSACHEGLYDILEEVRDMNRNKRTDLSKFISQFVSEIQRHLIEEETTFFSEIEIGNDDIDRASIDQLMNDHDIILSNLMEIRKLTQNYAEQTDYIQKLKEMDRILMNHVQLENNILFPMVLNRYLHQ